MWKLFFQRKFLSQQRGQMGLPNTKCVKFLRQSLQSRCNDQVLLFQVALWGHYLHLLLIPQHPTKLYWLQLISAISFLKHQFAHNLNLNIASATENTHTPRLTRALILKILSLIMSIKNLPVLNHSQWVLLKSQKKHLPNQTKRKS